MKQEKKISKIKLLEGGLKGMEIEYLTTKVVKNRSYEVERKEKRKVPVSGTLMNMFSELAKYFEDISRTQGAIVYGIKITNIGFQLIGEVETGINNKSIHYATPFITEDDEYASFENVNKSIAILTDETMKYMSGENEYSDRQLVMQFYEKKDKGMLADMKGKSDAEITEEAIKILESKGCLVMVPEVFDIEAVEVEAFIAPAVVFGPAEDLSVQHLSKVG